MGKIINAILLICYIVVSDGQANAQANPPNWPWRGITVLSGLTLTGVTAKDIQYLASININAVDISLTIRSTAERYNLPAEKALEKDLQWADTLLNECKKVNITGILSVYQIPIDPKLGITQVSPEFWNNPERYQEAIRLAGIIAEHFKNRGSELGAYEFLSEHVIVTRDGKSHMPEVW